MTQAVHTLSHSSPPVWHVLGAGAMGCLWAGALSVSTPASPACLLLRDADAIARFPGEITIESANVVPHKIPVNASNGALLRQSEARITHLLVTTKAQDVMSAIGSVRDCIADNAVIILLQNGIRAQLAANAVLSAQRVFAMSTNHGVWLRAPYHAVHAGVGEAWLGSLSSSTLMDTRLLLSQLPQKSMNIHLDTDIVYRLWFKFAINCAINALTVIYDCNNGGLLSHTTRKTTLLALCAEIQQLFEQLPETPLLTDLPGAVVHVLNVTATNVSSTLQDIRRGRPTEITELNGYLTELAVLHGLPCPLNQRVLAAVKKAERALPTTDRH
tara:strand:- start:124320 stop:125306 length:987 start_codon:yes stop_codon:yes gene_type:complete